MRRGVLLVEVLAGCALTGVLLVLCVQLLSLSAVERHDTERRAIALEQAANLIEHVAVMPYDAISAESLAALALPDELEPILPGASAKWSVAEEPGDVPSKRVRVEVAWKGGRAQVPARLTYWAYPQPKPAGGTP